LFLVFTLLLRGSRRKLLIANLNVLPCHTLPSNVTSFVVLQLSIVKGSAFRFQIPHHLFSLLKVASLTDSMQLRPFLTAHSRSATQENPRILWAQVSLSCSEEPAIGSFPEPNESSPTSAYAASSDSSLTAYVM
jgi:hypothetical protein